MQQQQQYLHAQTRSDPQQELEPQVFLQPHPHEIHQQWYQEQLKAQLLQEQQQQQQHALTTRKRGHETDEFMGIKKRNMGSDTNPLQGPHAFGETTMASASPGPIAISNAFAHQSQHQNQHQQQFQQQPSSNSGSSHSQGSLSSSPRQGYFDHQPHPQQLYNHLRASASTSRLHQGSSTTVHGGNPSSAPTTPSIRAAEIASNTMTTAMTILSSTSAEATIHSGERHIQASHSNPTTPLAGQAALSHQLYYQQQKQQQELAQAQAQAQGQMQGRAQPNGLHDYNDPTTWVPGHGAQQPASEGHFSGYLGGQGRGYTPAVMGGVAALAAASAMAVGQRQAHQAQVQTHAQPHPQYQYQHQQYGMGMDMEMSV
ncbi:hypothetical protein BGW38_004650 [Lunasporangiospora selenospora]|uniref:Uncharacterized protein n=1 Tax=Lunasporangiospora selenospora TaxID=979761 RepID=A0A9P6KBD7_9FUNG|nr:hypothetical protein BGW38_004650 [Lunasporangiospora selenospora]